MVEETWTARKDYSHCNTLLEKLAVVATDIGWHCMMRKFELRKQKGKRNLPYAEASEGALHELRRLQDLRSMQHDLADWFKQMDVRASRELEPFNDSLLYLIKSICKIGSNSRPEIREKQLSLASDLYSITSLLRKRLFEEHQAGNKTSLALLEFKVFEIK